VDADSVAARVAIVLQKPTQWPLTARHNVTLGRPDRSDPAGVLLAAAARGSGADAVVEELPYGRDTVLAAQFRHGRDLSGGQWQRLGIALLGANRAQEARRTLEQAVRLFGELGDGNAAATYLIDLGRAHQQLGNTTAAITAWTDALHVLAGYDEPNARRLRTMLAEACAG